MTDYNTTMRMRSWLEELEARGLIEIPNERKLIVAANVLAGLIRKSITGEEDSDD